MAVEHGPDQDATQPRDKTNFRKLFEEAKLAPDPRLPEAETNAFRTAFRECLDGASSALDQGATRTQAEVQYLDELHEQIIAASRRLQDLPESYAATIRTQIDGAYNDTQTLERRAGDEDVNLRLNVDGLLKGMREATDRALDEDTIPTMKAERSYHAMMIPALRAQKVVEEGVNDELHTTSQGRELIDNLVREIEDLMHRELGEGNDTSELAAYLRSVSDAREYLTGVAETADRAAKDRMNTLVDELAVINSRVVKLVQQHSLPRAA